MTYPSGYFNQHTREPVMNKFSAHVSPRRDGHRYDSGVNTPIPYEITTKTDLCQSGATLIFRQGGRRNLSDHCGISYKKQHLLRLGAFSVLILRRRVVGVDKIQLSSLHSAHLNSCWKSYNNYSSSKTATIDSRN